MGELAHAVLPTALIDLGLCDKCDEIDKTIVRYRQILLSIDDQVTIERTNELIAELHAKKAELHTD
jgi:hypothetical protein